jgi:O-antigen/teichoic acid export membrane protein
MATSCDLLLSRVRGIITYFGASAIPLVINLAVNPLIAMNMSPRDYAISGYYCSFSSLIGPLISFYLIGYYLKDYFKLDTEGREELYKEIANALIFLSALISVLCFIGLFIYLTAIKRDLEFPVMPYLALMVFSIPMSGLFSLKLAKLRIERKTKSFFMCSTITSCFGILLTVVMVVILKLGAFGKLLASFIGSLVVFLYMVIENRKLVSLRIPLRRYKELIVFCGPLALGSMMEYFSGGFTNTYLESIGDINEYGYYIVGASMGGYLMTFSLAIMHTFQPDIFEYIAKKNNGKLIKTIAMELLLIGTGVLLFIALAPQIIGLLTAGRYVASANYARIIAMTSFTTMLFYHVNDFSIINNHQHMYLVTTIIGSIFIVIAMKFATQYFSYTGGAWVNVMSNVIFAAVNLVLLVLYRNKKLCYKTQK